MAPQSPVLTVCYRACLRVKGLDKAQVLGQSYMKVFEYSWRLGTGCIVSLQSHLHEVICRDIHSLKPQTLLGNRERP